MKKSFKKLSILFAKLRRRFRFSLLAESYKLNPEERKILSIVNKSLNAPGSKIANVSSKVVIQTEDKNYTIVYDDVFIKISNHKFFFKSRLETHFSEELMRLAIQKIRKDQEMLEGEINQNEFNFLDNLNETLRNKSSQLT